jgi:hypothetical protein
MAKSDQDKREAQAAINIGVGALGNAVGGSAVVAGGRTIRVNTGPGPGGSSGTEADLLAQFNAALQGSAQVKPTTYDAAQDIYGLGVVSSTPVRYRSTLGRSGSLQEIVGGMRGPEAAVTVPSTVGDQLKRLYSMGPQEVAGWQRKLYEGGFYDASIKFEQIIPGIVDGDTDRAWYRAVLSAARSTAAGQQTTVEDVIDMTAQALDYQGPSSGGGGAAAYQPTRLSDPAALKAMADQVATNLIGRRLTDEEKDKIVGNIHGAETAFSGAVRGKAGTLTDVDPQARVQEAIQADFKREYDATNVANTYDVFSKIIAGSRG